MAISKDKIPGLVSKEEAIAMLGKIKTQALKHQINSQMNLLFQLLFGMNRLKNKGICDTETKELIEEILIVLDIDEKDIVTLEHSEQERNKVVDGIHKYKDVLQDPVTQKFGADENSIQQVELRVNRIEKIWQKKFMGPLSSGDLIVPEQLRAYLYGVDHAFSYIQFSRQYLDAIDPAFVGSDIVITAEEAGKIDDHSWLYRILSNKLGAAVVPAITTNIDIDLAYMEQARQFLLDLPEISINEEINSFPGGDADEKYKVQEQVITKTEVIDNAIKQAHDAFGFLTVLESVGEKKFTTFIGDVLKSYADTEKKKTESLIFVSLLEMDELLQKKKEIIGKSGDWSKHIAILHGVCEECKRNKEKPANNYIENLRAAKDAIITFSTLVPPETKDEIVNRALWQIKAQADAIYYEKDKPSIIAAAVGYVEKHVLEDKPVYEAISEKNDNTAISWAAWGWSFVTAGAKAILNYGVEYIADNQVSAKLTDHLGVLISINKEIEDKKRSERVVEVAVVQKEKEKEKEIQQVQKTDESSKMPQVIANPDPIIKSSSNIFTKIGQSITGFFSMIKNSVLSLFGTNEIKLEDKKLEVLDVKKTTLLPKTSLEDDNSDKFKNAPKLEELSPEKLNEIENHLKNSLEFQKYLKDNPLKGALTESNGNYIYSSSSRTPDNDDEDDSSDDDSDYFDCEEEKLVEISQESDSKEIRDNLKKTKTVTFSEHKSVSLEPPKSTINPVPVKHNNHNGHNLT